MSFFQRVATIATITIGIAAIMGGSTPGFASQLSPAFNAPAGVVVPGSDIPAEHVQIDSVLAADEALAQDDDFTTLSQAVAAQDMPDTIGNDLTCLAGAIYFESKGEPLSGQLAVAEVILNRAKSGRFGSSICSVVTQRGQFSFVRGGRVPAVANNRDYRTAIAVAKVALGAHWDSPAPNALYFHARRVSPGWRMQKIAAIGNHVFYR